MKICQLWNSSFFSYPLLRNSEFGFSKRFNSYVGISMVHLSKCHCASWFAHNWKAAFIRSLLLQIQLDCASRWTVMEVWGCYIKSLIGLPLCLSTLNLGMGFVHLLLYHRFFNSSSCSGTFPFWRGWPIFKQTLVIMSYQKVSRFVIIF